MMNETKIHCLETLTDRRTIHFLLSLLFMGLSINTPIKALAEEALPLPSGNRSILAPNAKVEPLFTEGFFTEGPAVAKDGTVYFTELHFSSGKLVGSILHYDPKTDQTTIFRSPSGMASGLVFDAQGRLLAAEGAGTGGRRVTRTDVTTGQGEVIADLFEGRSFNAPNDLAIDEQGRIYFSDPRYYGHEPIEQPVMAVYRIDPDSSIHRIITDAGKPNGVAVSPDQKSLYVVSNDNGNFGLITPTRKGRMALLAYDLHPDGSAQFREVLVDYAPQDGPDGLACDIKGNIYAAVRDTTRPGIYVYSPQGEELAYIPTPIPTNVEFGRGEDSKILYITYGGILARIQVEQDGYHLPEPE